MADSPRKDAASGNPGTKADAKADRQERIERRNDRLRISPVRGDPFFAPLKEPEESPPFRLAPDALARIFDALSSESKIVLEEAAGLARTLTGERRKLHMEHLLFSLLNGRGAESARELFQNAGLSLQSVANRVQHLGLTAPAITPGVVQRYFIISRVTLDRMPEASGHVQMALAGAARAAGLSLEAPSEAHDGIAITPSHLLAGFASVKQCRLVAIFQDVWLSIDGGSVIAGAPSPTDASATAQSSITPQQSSQSTPSSAAASEAATPQPQSANVESPPAGSAQGTGRAAEQRQLATPALDPVERTFGLGEGAINDRPEQAEDQLEFEHYIKAFADLIESPDTAPPITIGIFGSWGAGKSFLLWHLQQELSERARNRRRLLSDALRGQPLKAVPLVTARHLGEKLARARNRTRRWISDGIRVRRQRFVARWKGEAAPPRPADREARHIHAVTFNAWEYSAAERIWPRLVRAVLQQVEHDVRWTTRPLLAIEKFFRKLRYNLPRKLRSDWKELVAWVAVGALVGFLIRGPSGADGNATFDFFGLSIDGKFALPSLLAGLAGLAKLFKEMLLQPLGGWISALLDEGLSYGGQIDYMAAIKADLDLLERRLAKSRARVLIVIDDLDRCEPDKMIEVLQAVNLLLDRPSFVVCLGLDARVVTAAVEKHYKDLLGPAGITGYEYLDKIIQIPFRIPDPSRDQLENLLTKQLGDPLLREEREAAERAEARRAQEQRNVDAPPPGSVPNIQQSRTLSEQIEDAIIDRTVENIADVVSDRSMLRGTVDESPSGVPASNVNDAPLTFSSDELRAFTSVAGFLRPNPRHIKRLVNVYALVRSLSVSRGEQGSIGGPESTARWLVLAAQWPYSVRQMLLEFDDLAGVAPPESGDDSNWRPPDVEPGEPALRRLYSSARIDPALQRRFDYDVSALGALVADSDFLSWNQLRLLRRYTLNFNPALDAELRVTRNGQIDRRQNTALRREIERSSRALRNRELSSSTKVDPSALDTQQLPSSPMT